MQVHNQGSDIIDVSEAKLAAAQQVLVALGECRLRVETLGIDLDAVEGSGDATPAVDRRSAQRLGQQANGVTAGDVASLSSVQVDLHRLLAAVKQTAAPRLIGDSYAILVLPVGLQPEPRAGLDL